MVLTSTTSRITISPKATRKKRNRCSSNLIRSCIICNVCCSITISCAIELGSDPDLTNRVEKDSTVFLLDITRSSFFTGRRTLELTGPRRRFFFLLPFHFCLRFPWLRSNDLLGHVIESLASSVKRL